jgi:hypothetical protein
MSTLLSAGGVQVARESRAWQTVQTAHVASFSPFHRRNTQLFLHSLQRLDDAALSQRLYEHEDWRHSITDPCLHTFAVRSQIFSLWRFQDILAHGTMNRPAGDLACIPGFGAAFWSDSACVFQSKPLFKKQPCIMYWSGTIYRLCWQSAIINRMDSEAYGVTIHMNCVARGWRSISCLNCNCW